MINSRLKLTVGGATIALVGALWGSTAWASDASDAKELVSKATATVNAFANNPDFASLPGMLGKAKAVIVFPQVLEGGFVVGGSGGTGVLLVRDERSGAWGGPAFYTMGSIKLGFLAGGQAAEVIMVLNTQSALDSMYTAKVKLGGDASVAAGPKGAGTGAAVMADFISFAKTKGAYAGVALDGSVLGVREGLNAGYYGKAVTPVDILVKKTASSPDSTPLQNALKAAAK